jgi:hypothetical protein
VTKWTAEQVMKVLGDRLAHLDAELHRELEGFPEHYATQIEIDLLRTAIDAIRLDHVARRELDEVKKNSAAVIDRLQVRLDEQQGRRSATIVAASIIATILAVMFGFIWQAQITRSEVSDQISREAPWTKDKTPITNEIQQLEAQNTAQKVQINQLQIQMRFVCRTRNKAGLPGC